MTGIHLRALKSAAERRVEGVEVGATDYIHTAPSSSLLCGNQPVSVVPMAFDIASRRWRDGQCDVYLHWRELVATTAAPAPAAAAPASAVSASSEAAAAAAALASAFSGGSAHVVVRRPAGRNGEQDSLAATALLSCADVCRSHGWRAASPAGQAQPQTASSAAPQLAGEQVVLASLGARHAPRLCNTARLAQTQPSRELLLQEYVTGRCSGRLNANAH